MTERKPPEMTFTSWIDQQIIEAEKRGVFDNLPGTGKPLPAREEADYGQAWLRDYLRREGVPTEELLPTPLRLRKETERLAAGAQSLRSEQEVREAVGELNQRIMDWRRTSAGGPPIFVPLMNEENIVARWRDAQSVRPASSPSDAGRTPAVIAPARHGWWRRLRRRGS